MYDVDQHPDPHSSVERTISYFQPARRNAVNVRAPAPAAREVEASGGLRCAWVVRAGALERRWIR